MSVLVYIETVNGSINKGGFELATYGRKTSEILQTECYGLVIGNCNNIESLSSYGLTKVLQCKDDNLASFDSQTYTNAILKAGEKHSSDIFIVRHSADGKTLAGMLAAKLDAGCVTGTNAVPSNTNGFTVTKGVYSGKAIVSYKIDTAKKVLSMMGNSIQPEEAAGNTTIEEISLNVSNGKTKVVNRETVSGIVPLPEAELVVSAGRGMKGPENWGIIEDLAETLGATTACSRPVADAGWRPHHEHVGQTGVKVSPELYIAVGISGAIQHLAGVNSSKNIVVINKDSEAPFFKAADYGIVGDAFEVIPKLTEAIKAAK